MKTRTERDMTRALPLFDPFLSEHPVGVLAHRSLYQGMVRGVFVAVFKPFRTLEPDVSPISAFLRDRL